MSEKQSDYQFIPILPSNDFDPIFYSYQDSDGDLVIDWNEAYDPREIDMISGMRRRKHLAHELAANLTSSEVLPFLYTAAEGVDAKGIFFGIAAAGMALQASITDSRMLTEQYVQEFLESNWGLKDESHRRVVIPNRKLDLFDTQSCPAKDLHTLLRTEMVGVPRAFKYTLSFDVQKYKKVLKEQTINLKKKQFMAPEMKRALALTEAYLAAIDPSFYTANRNDEMIRFIDDPPTLSVNPAVIIDEILHRPGMSRRFDLLVPYVFGIGETIRQKSEAEPISHFPNEAIEDLSSLLRFC
ncbi:hypothetical protein KDA23_05050 [Candidatus Saccharibacteria bacterium]|nr:hypothetical protein [Candidatus Saccharibacteria bacterium]